MAATVVIGAGIIGCATAYYISESEGVDPSSIHLVEASPELFASASGKSGGFLVSDWFASEVAPLGELSFQLHKDLAAKHDGANRWSYSLSTGTSYEESTFSNDGRESQNWLLDGGSRAATAGKHEFFDGVGPAWLARYKGDSLEVVGSHENTAQVDPLRLSQFLLDECRKRGVQLHQPATVFSIDIDDDRCIQGVTIRTSDGRTQQIACKNILLTAGAWTGRVFKELFPDSETTLPVSSLAGHSLVLRSPRWTKLHEAKGCHAVFSTVSIGFSPEIFSRLGGDIYVAGLNDSSLPLPKLATDAKIDAASIDKLKDVARKMLGRATDPDDLQIAREGLCFRPVTPGGRPRLSRIPDLHLGGIKSPDNGGVYMAAGHGPWGIALSLGTGKAMADLIRRREDGLDLTAFALG